MTTAVEAEQKTCLITLVNPGRSDSVIKVFPAQHEKEKIWLDNARGIERWEAVERLLQNHAERGKAVPKPAPWHSDPKELRVPDLDPKDIPLVRLEGAILAAPPEEAKIDYTKTLQPAAVQAKRIESLEAMVGSLAQAVSSLTTELQAAKTASSTPTPVASQPVVCPECTKRCKTHAALKAHKTKMHGG